MLTEATATQQTYEAEVRSLRAMNRALLVQLEAVTRVGLNHDGRGFADVGQLVEHLRTQVQSLRARALEVEADRADAVAQAQREQETWAIRAAWNKALEAASTAIARAHQLRGDLYLTDACEIIDGLKLVRTA